MNITTTMKFVATGLSFETIAKAMDQSNVCSYIHQEVADFLEAHGLDKVPHIFMATHSVGGRDWDAEENAEPVFFEEKTFNGGWYIFRDEDVSYLYCESATSGSSLAATKQEDGTWTLVLEVPVEDGKPYEGAYHGAFHRALLEEGSWKSPYRKWANEEAAANT